VANDFNASVVISTKESEAGIRALDSASKDLDKTLRSLDGALKGAQGNLDVVQKSMAELTRANAALIRSEQDRAKATVLAAKADGQMIVNQTKRQKSANDTAIAEAKANKIRQQTLSAGLTASAGFTRKDAESRARVAATEAVAQARVTSELQRGAVAQQNLATATIRTASAAEMAAARSARLEGAQRRTASGTLELNDSLSNSRYLLYDVGQTYAVIAAAMQVIPVATAAVAIAYEKDFAQVIRTNDTLANSTGGFAQLRDELKQLATEIPLTFGQFSEIATIGGQLGIAGQDIESFTETVARFGAASNVSIDEAATAFGRLQNSYDPKKLNPDFFNQIGSAIAYVGVKSAATEAEIIAVNNQISAAGAQFGFAADEIVGLSGALASVRIRPELARGAFQRIMLGLNRAADEGAESFQKYGKYTGLAAEEALNLFKTDPSKFFHQYVGGIKNAIAETGSVSAVLDDIGAKNVFDKQFLLGLANGYNVFTDSLQNSNKAWKDGSFLTESTAGIYETVDAKLKRIANGFKNIGDSIGKASVGEGSGLDKLTDSVLAATSAVDRFINAAPGIAQFINIMMGLGSVIGILIAFKAAQAFMLAGLVGFQQVLGKGTLAAGLTAKGILQQLAVTMLMAKGVSQQHAQALVVQSGALRAMGMSAQVANAQLASSAGGMAAGVVASTDAATKSTNRLVGAFKAGIGMLGGPIGISVMALGTLAFSFIQTAEEAATAGEAIARAMDQGADAATRASADAIAKIKVAWHDPIALGNLDRSLAEVARDAGVPFEKLAAAAAKGRDAGKEVLAVMDQIARSKGFENFAAMRYAGGEHAGQMEWLKNKITEIGDKSAVTGEDLKDVKTATDAFGGAAADAGPNAEMFASEIGGVGDEAETAADKIDKFLDAVFGIVDAAGASQSALQALGEGLFDSLDFGPNTEGGRANVENFKEALRSAAQEQQYLIDSTGKSTQQASADYIAFVDGLVQEMIARGVDPTNLQVIAEQAKQGVANVFQGGVQPTITPKVDGTQAAAEAQQVAAGVEASVNKPYTTWIFADGSQALNESAGVEAYASSVAREYTAGINADASAGIENTSNFGFFANEVTGANYEAKVNADTSPAILNLQNLANFAQTVINAIQFGIGLIGTGINNKKQVGAEIGNVKAGAALGPSAASAPSPVAAPVVNRAAAPAVIPTPKAVTPNFGSLNDGYNKAAKAAEKAGDAGKKAGKDMANGIDDAAEAANDYANRLKTGLTAAFDRQYGLQKATDEYHSALNAINKKREDELKQIDDLITAQKELNNERAEELVNARKAQIEKDISLKYGEVDRAADYAQQEQEALDAAAAKQKDIEANNAQIISLQAGIGQLEGYSEAAIANRAALRDLESKMLDMVVAYANTGASVDQVRNYAAGLTNQFKIDVSQMGYNQWAVGQLQGSLERYIGVVNAVPYHKPTTITADVGTPTSGAMGAVNAFGAAADWAARPRNTTLTLDTSAATRALRHIEAQIRGGGTAEDPSMTAFEPGTFSRRAGGGIIPGFAGGGQIPGKAPSNLKHDNMMASVDGRGLVQVQSEEFIMQKRAVDFWGLDMMNALNNMKMPQFNTGGSFSGRGGSGSGSSGPMLVELTAENLQAILRLAERDIHLFADTEQLASSVNEGQRVLASKGVS